MDAANECLPIAGDAMKEVADGVVIADRLDPADPLHPAEESDHEDGLEDARDGLRQASQLHGAEGFQAADNRLSADGGQTEDGLKPQDRPEREAGSKRDAGLKREARLKWEDGLNSEAGSQAVDDEDIATQLSFREAQTALELSLSELQAADLDVEEMAALYRRACRYAERCEALLQRLEQQVLQWDPEQPQDPPRPYEA